mmetsp:Transcript_9805/g.17920  ORF Transcript_9805/g.17920 Transcript_9805/m.17920 type:complete len:236 (+) Transcript_9805:2-709(+)
MLQHVLPVSSASTSTGVVAEVVNAIRLELLWGMVNIWILLRGDAVPLKQDEENSTNDKVTTDKKPTPQLLPNLSDRTVKVYFDKPRIGFSLQSLYNKNKKSRQVLLQRVLSLGPTSSVVLDTPYVDERLRLGKGGISGSQFVFARVAEDDVEAREGWKWLLTSDMARQSLNKNQLMIRTGVWCLLSGLACKLLQNNFLGKWIAGMSTAFSLVALLWISFSTGGIETRGDTYARGR